MPHLSRGRGTKKGTGAHSSSSAEIPFSSPAFSAGLFRPKILLKIPIAPFFLLQKSNPAIAMLANHKISPIIHCVPSICNAKKYGEDICS
jgi:hypothetical protein